MKRLLFLMPVLLLMGCSKEVAEPEIEYVEVEMSEEDMIAALESKGYTVLNEFDAIDYKDAMNHECNTEDSEDLESIIDTIRWLPESEDYIYVWSYFNDPDMYDITYDEAKESFNFISEYVEHTLR